MPTKESMIYGGSFYQGENWLHPGLFEAQDVKSSRLEMEIGKVGLMDTGPELRTKLMGRC